MQNKNSTYNEVAELPIKYSITIPAYKARFLDEAIRSIISQTYNIWELIIVDDNSPEDIKSIYDIYNFDKRIHYYRNNQNCGAVNVVDNWNICLSYCTGDYVICMGDDDRLLPCCLEEYNKLIKAHPGLEVYHAKTQIIDESGMIIGYQENRPPFETCQEMLLQQWSNKRIQFIGDFLFSRQWLNKNGGYVKFPLAYSSDWATANLAAKEKGIANGHSLMFEYRDNHQSISHSQNLKTTVMACNSSHQWYLEILQEILPPVFESYFLESVTDLIYLDVRRSPISSSVYWITHKNELFLPYSKIIETCLRGIFAYIRKGKK